MNTTLIPYMPTKGQFSPIYNHSHLCPLWFITMFCFQQIFPNRLWTHLHLSIWNETASVQGSQHLSPGSLHLCTTMVFPPLVVRIASWYSRASQCSQDKLNGYHNLQRPEDLALPLLQPCLVLGSILRTIPWWVWPILSSWSTSHQQFLTSGNLYRLLLYS